MLLLFFSCLQGVQTESTQTQLVEDCNSICNQYKTVCTQEQDCSSLCTTIGIQISSRGCDSEAQALWTCQESGEWTCTDELPVLIGDECSAQEGSYLECITPEDTGSLSN